MEHMMGGKASRDKGIRFELAMAALFRVVFPNARRGKQTDNPRDCDLEGTTARWELKHWKNWPSVVRAYQQCRKNAEDWGDTRPLGVIVTRDHAAPYVVFEVPEFLRFCEENFYSDTNDNLVRGPWENTNGE